MITTKSFSEKSRSHSYFMTSLRRQTAFMVVSGIVLFMIIVVPYLVGAPSHQDYYGVIREKDIADYYKSFFAGIYFSESQSGVIGVFLALLSFASALFATRYMHSKKMTDLFHALPIRREKMLLINTGTSMLAILGPFTVIYLLTMAGQMAAYARYGWVNAAYWRFLALDYLTIVTLVWVVYTLTTFVAVNVGTTFDALAVSGTFMFLPTLVYLVCGAVWQVAYYGAYFTAQYALRLSPFLFFFERYTYRGDTKFIFAVWLLLGCLLLGAAIFLYRRRKSEIAEQTQPRGLFQMTVKVFAGFCGGAVFLFIFQDRSLPAQVLAIFLGGTAIALITELILSRGLRSIAKNIKWLAGACLVFGLLYLGVSVDFFGFERRVPAVNTVASVEVNYSGRYSSDMDLTYYYATGSYRNGATVLTDPESIEIVRRAHQSLLEAHARDEDSYYGYYSVELRYKLRGGGEVVRRYYGVDADSYRILAELEGQEDFIRSNSTLFSLTEYDALPGTHLTVSVGVGSTASSSPRSLSLEDQQLDALLTALQNDSLRQTLNDVLNPTGKVYGYICLTYGDPSRPYDYWEYSGWEEMPYVATEFGATTITVTESVPERDTLGELWVAVTSGYTETLDLLEEYDALKLMETDFAEIAEVRVVNPKAGSYRYSQDRAVNIMPDGMYDFRWQMEDDEMMLQVTDPQEIRAMAAKGCGSMLLERETPVMVMQFYDQKGNAMAAQFIRVEDLPASIRSQASRLEETVYSVTAATYAESYG